MTALVLAGGLPQIELIRQLQQRGVTAILADGNENALARPYADGFYRVNIFDIDAVKNIALREQVDFLITCCADQVLLVVAQVSELLGLPWYIDYKTARLVSDKEQMKQVFVRNNIPTAPFIVIAKPDTAATSHLRYPLIVKPVDAYSSRGVRKVFCPEELTAAFTAAKDISRTGTVIVEEFCEGEEISVDVYVDNGKAHILCISNSDKIRDAEKFVIFRGRIPACITPELDTRIQEISQQIADAFCLRNAPMLVQMIIRDNDVSVLEFCARTGGAMKYRLIQQACGFDVIRAVIDLTMGTRPLFQLQPSQHKYIVNDFLYCRPGVFDHLEGFNELVTEGLLTEYHTLRPQGFVCSGQANSSSDRVAGFMIQADSIDEFNRIHQLVLKRIRVIDRDGNDILRRELLPDLT